MRAKPRLESVRVLIEALDNLDMLAEYCRYEHIPVQGYESLRSRIAANSLCMRPMWKVFAKALTKNW